MSLLLKGYMMEWAFNNHKKVCPFKESGVKDDADT